ncbi:NAD(P)/FAD-dependent oxidoreductase [Pseudonocardia dioxanivorans]|uniref:NAD(P)/FAD-dependent oxidoreductase n=1 Tax=Pseudonocardia dioxanivorans TaxID=240495 RepID=UPI001FB62797|nr:FAD-dependent oxidoreductase [Pseudonocardia dioxanivorans]
MGATSTTTNDTDTQLGPVVVVGGGQAGFQAAVSLRDHGFPGAVTIVTDEPDLPYQRPPLSKAYLTAGADESVALTLRPREFYERHAVQIVEDPAIEIDRAGRRVLLRSGRALGYGALVLATGARARPVPVPGGELGRVFVLRTSADAGALRSVLVPGARMVVIGGGFVGMEVAASARTVGVAVTVVEALDRVLARVVAPEVSAHVQDTHDRAGTRVLLGRTVRALHGEAGRVAAVELSDGEVLPADLVVVGIGALPNVELARACGLDVADGIVVDAALRTGDPRISAIGDCASYPSRHAGARTRLESVQNAVGQARYVARRLAGVGPTEPYGDVPWFWTNQLGLRIQTAGIGRTDDRTVVHGEPAEGSFSVYRFHGDRLVCVESVNQTGDHMAARKVLAGDRGPDPDAVAAAGFDLRRFAAAGTDGG